MNVLVVDDSRSIRGIIALYVEELGHTAIPAEDGEQALKLFHTEKIDLVLMDIEMPGINGYEVTKRLRLDLGDHWLPVIFLSSNKSDEHFVEGINAGGDAYLFKPVNGPVLQAMVAAMSRIARMQEKLEEANQRLEEMANHDSLTGLYNRRSLSLQLDKEWRQAERTGTSLSLLSLDADYFKLFNDCYGHIAGDKCLVFIADRLKDNAARPRDCGFRVGGEEFLMLLPETDIGGAMVVAERLRKSIEDGKIEHERSPNSVVTVSIGATTKKAGESCEQFLKRADDMLYQAKRGKRNCVVADSETNAA